MPAWTINDQVQKMTENAIESINDTPLIIIDNASPQGGGYLRSKADVYVRNKENLGFAKAVNQGIKLAQTRHVAVVSTDVRVSANWKDVAEEVFKDSDVFSTHFKMINYDKQFESGDMTAYIGMERWCTAAFFVLDREKGLLFDEDYFNSFEDWDLFYRAHKEGYKTAYTNKASYQHAHSFTQQFVGFKGSERNREIFTKKHGVDPDELLAQTYPEQMKVNYWEGFK
jgi:GT2 family glycosyltransferase